MTMVDSNTGHCRMPLLMPDDFSDLHLCAWRVEPGRQDENNPLIEGDKPWDSGGVGIHGTVLKDPIDGLWKAWLVTTPPEETSDDWPNGWASVANDRDRNICHFESRDGVKWTRPELSSTWGEHKTTNVIFDSSVYGLQAYASVLVDPENSDWPYEMFVLQTPTAKATPPHGSGYHRYRSRDGRKWEWVNGPTTGCVSGDVLFVYPWPDGGYVGYYRTGMPLQPDDHVPVWEDCPRRTCFRAFSADGTHWEHDDAMVIQRDERDHRDTQFMECVPIRVPGGYVAMVSVYWPITQTLDTRMAASRDGARWWFPDRRPCLPNAPMGDYGGGMIWQSKDLTAEGNTLYMYYAGAEGAHRQISATEAPSVEIGHHETALDKGGHFLPFNTALCRASWRFDRMYALVASAGGATIGTAVTREDDLAAGALSVNITTRPAKKSSRPGFDEGYLRVELLDEAGTPIPGYTRDDCPPLKGDHEALPVTWSGGDQAPPSARKAKFYLKRAFLYGFRFER